MRNALIFSHEEISDGLSQSLMGQPVHGLCAHGKQAPCQVVFTLRATFETAHALFNAPHQRLVVAGFEVQALHEAEGAPVAAMTNALRAVHGQQRAGQLGAILAVIWEFRAKVLGVVVGLPSDPNAQRFTFNLLLAFMPAVVLGVIFADVIHHYLFNPITVATALVVGGLIILWVFGAGSLMWRLRNPVRDAVRRIPLNWPTGGYGPNTSKTCPPVKRNW